MKCILTGCKNEVAPGRMWFCPVHYGEATYWWFGKVTRASAFAVVHLARSLRAIGTTVDGLVQAVESPSCYPEEAYWLWTRDQHKDMVVAGTAVVKTAAVTLAPEGACQQRDGAYLVQECGCGGDDCRR